VERLLLLFLFSLFNPCSTVRRPVAFSTHAPPSVLRLGAV